MQMLYVMLSRTSTGMGKFIRFFTRGSYNHVSLTLDDNLSSFVSFARYRIDAPLSGGYIRETGERLLYRDTPVPVVIFRVPIPTERHRVLTELFSHAGRDDRLIYNSLGALTGWLGFPRPVVGAYTCLEFANRVLDTDFTNIGQLQAYLQSCLYFQGDLRELMTDSGSREDPYFHRRGFLRSTGDTFTHFAHLAGHVFRPKRYTDPVTEALTDKTGVLP